MVRFGADEAGAEKQRPRPHAWEVARDLEIFEPGAVFKRSLQERAQSGDIPLAVPEVVEEPVLRFLGRHEERLIE